jgi:hypothetical protein
MSKIRELQSHIKAGARTNKYRVIYPLLGQSIDILCHNITLVGRGLGVVDVYYKGREIKFAGDRGDSGTFSMSFYNDEEMKYRTFFLKIISAIQNYSDPESFNITGISLQEIISDLFKPLGINPLSFDFIGSKPWYWTDIIIQQLDHNDEVISSVVLWDAWVTSVGDIDYTDETGDVSQTQITFAYSGIGAGYGSEPYFQSLI